MLSREWETWLLPIVHIDNDLRMFQRHFPLQLCTVLDPQKNGSQSLFASSIHFGEICLLILQGCPYIPIWLLPLQYGKVSHREDVENERWVIKSHFPTVCLYYVAFPWGTGIADGGEHGHGERISLQVCLVLLWAPGKSWQWYFTVG